MIDQNKIYVTYGDRPKDMVLAALDKLDLAAELAELGRGATVALKPNLVVDKPASSGATTSPGIVEGLLEYLKDHGISRLWIMESSAVGYSTGKAFRAVGYDSPARRYGAELIDLKEESSSRRTDGDFQARVFDRVGQVDYLINLPVIKAHCQTRITCALKNLKGLIPDSEKRRFHSSGLHRPIAGLNRLIKPNLIVADGMMGDLSFEEGGQPVRMDRIMLAKDPVLLDSFVAHNLGYRWEEIRHIVLAAEMGVGRPWADQEQIVQLNRPLTASEPIEPGRGIKALLKFIDSDQACSSCHGGLIFALERLSAAGKLNRLPGPIAVGQGFKDKTGPVLGVGQCCRGAKLNIGGCPPRAADIVAFLEQVVDGPAR